MELTQAPRPGSFLLSEANGSLSRDHGVLAVSQSILPGQVLGIIAAVLIASSAAKAGGNTGNGALTLDAATPVLAGAKPGVYTVRCVAAAANAGTFRVTDPDGFVLGDVAVGATFANDIKFAVADGATDFVVGDGFDITVAADDEAEGVGQYAALDPSATNGTQIAAALSWDGYETTADATLQIALLSREAEVIDSMVVWPDGITDSQKTAAVAQLKANHIVLR